MSKERADLGFGDALDEFNPAEWVPTKPKPVSDRPKKEATEQAAAAAGFRSREPKHGPAPAAGAGASRLRRRRTGRNAQFNLKARPATIEAYCAIADRMGWGLGETLEHAVELLERDYPEK